MCWLSAAQDVIGNETDYTPMELARLKFEAFNNGFEGDELAQNFTACFDKGQQLKYFEMPTWKAKFHYGNGKEIFYNTTSFFQNMTYPLNVCTDAGEQIFYYVLDQIQFYGTGNELLKAMLYNLAGQAIRIQQLTTKMTQLNTDTLQDKLASIYYVGLLIKIVVIFDPPSDAGEVDIGEEDFRGARLLRQIRHHSFLQQEEEAVDSIDKEDSAVTSAPKGWKILLRPQYMVEYATGFLVGANITGSEEDLTVCSDTLSNNVVYSIMEVVAAFKEGLTAAGAFASLYHTYDVMFYSKPLVIGCDQLGRAIANTTVAAFTSGHELSRILNNFANNYNRMLTSFSDMRSFMSNPQAVLNDYPQDSFSAGFSTGRLLYYLLFDLGYRKSVTPVDPFSTLSNYDEAQADQGSFD